MLRFRRKVEALARVLPTFAFNCEENVAVEVEKFCVAKFIIRVKPEI
jgi:hypothetical protein